MDIHKVLEYLPHRYPFLLVDKVKEVVPGERITAIKNVTYNEPFFPGHFPIRPVMPGVLIIEAMAQACGILGFKTEETLLTRDAVIYLVGTDKARFKAPVEPGDQLELKAEIKRVIRGLWFFDAKAYVDGKLVAETEIMCTMKDV